MRFQVIVTRHAEGDLEEIIDFVADREGPIRAAGLADKLEAEVAALANAPPRGSIPKELKELGISEFRQVTVGPYRIFFRVVDHQVVVQLEADGRRDMRSLLERRLLSSE